MDPLNKSRNSIDQIIERDTSIRESKPSVNENSLENLRMISEKHVKNQIASESLTDIKSDVRCTTFDEDILSGSRAFQELDQLKTGNISIAGQISHSITAPPNIAIAASIAKTNSSISSPPDKQALLASNIKFGRKEQHELYGKLSIPAKWLGVKHGLTAKEAAAIHSYTRNEYFKDINNQFRALSLDTVDLANPVALKNAGVKNQDLAELISAMVIGMKKLPPAQLSDSYFMSLGRNVTMPEEELDLYKQDAEITVPTFLSTTVSANEMITDHWWDNKDNALFITQRVNGNGRDISVFSEFNKEKEILFLPNTKFKVMFRGEPASTTPGVSSTGKVSSSSNSNSKKVIKTLISMQEIPTDQAPQVRISSTPSTTQASDNSNLKKNGGENKATYFGLR
jgi:hypothetical protein